MLRRLAVLFAGKRRKMKSEFSARGLKIVHMKSVPNEPIDAIIFVLHCAHE
jgi:hypothetical protein